VKNPVVFSTLACPHWPVATVIARAVEYGYDGLEWRGGPQGHINPSASRTERSELRKAVLESNLISAAITAYTSFVSDKVEERNTNVDELKRYVDLAAEVGARYVRVFLGELPVGQKPTERIHDTIAQCLNVAAAYASKHDVSVAIEPHDDFVRSESLLPILERVPHPALTVIWDVANAFSAGEDVIDSFKNLRGRLAYVQVKDGTGRGSTWQLGPVGVGAVPLGQAIGLLKEANYTGAISVEWEAAWHPELDPPDVALPAALQVIRKLMATPAATV